MNKISNKIVEALKIQPLSDEEKSSRHILGRLYGPIATCEESTRNGRRYNRDLWEKALNDDVFKEKIANKSLFLELGHPADREETDMTKVCACIPEMPKIIDGDLYAYVDILDTANGRLLKTLCDYGFVPGISSRGSGDVLDNDEVDPDTFFLETWDIVQLPAVKKARLSISESLDTDSLKLKRALNESYSLAEDKDKIAMKEALDNLDIEIEEKAEEKPEEGKPLNEASEFSIGAVDEDGAEYAPSPEDELGEWDVLTESEDEDEKELEDEKESDEEKNEPEDEEPESEPKKEGKGEEKPEEKAEEEDKKDEAEAEEADVKSFIDLLKGFDKDAKIEFEPIVIDGNEYNVNGVTLDDVDGTVVAKVDYVPAEAEEAEAEDNSAELPLEEIPAGGESSEESEEPSLEAGSPEEEVGDAELDVLVDSLKEAVRKKDALAQEVDSLKSKAAVCDAEVKGLKESLEQYKSGFVRMSELAAKAKKSEQDAKALKESLAKKDAEIKSLRESGEAVASLRESYRAEASKTDEANQKAAALKAQNEKLIADLKRAGAQLKEAVAAAKACRAKAASTLDQYVSLKAELAGVRPADIKCRLSESYTAADVDKVCSSLLNESVAVSRLPFAGKNMRSVPKDVESDEDQFDFSGLDRSLIELAGLD